MVDINPEFVDVDFVKVFEDPSNEFVAGDLGIPSFEMFGSRAFEDTMPMLTKGEIWDAIEQIDEAGGGLDRMVTRIFNQKNEGSCFPPGTLVRMADGSNKPIEQVGLLDNVLTAEGNIRRVTQLMVREEKTGLCRLRLSGHSHLRMTKEHPILTKRGYIEVQNIKAGDWVRIPRYLPQTTKVLQTAEYLPVGEYASREKLKGPMKRGSNNGNCKQAVIIKSPVPDLIELDHEFGRLVGLFLAEGCTSQQKVTWTFSINERYTLVEELLVLLQQMGVEGRVREHEFHNSCDVTIYSVRWARLFEALCCNGAYNKRPHADLLSGPKEFLIGMLDGWLDGDGWRKPDGGKVVGTTISHALALCMFDIANAIGRRPIMQYSIPKLSHGVKSRKPRWDVCYSPNTKGNDGRFSEQEDGCLWRRVRGVERESYEGPVYNMEVEVDHSYVVEGIGVHNCVANACSQAHEILQAIQLGKENVVHLSAISLYKRIGRNARSGAVVSHGLKEMKQRGILPLDNKANRTEFGDLVMPNTGFNERFPDKWEDVAAKFAGVEYHLVKSIEGLMTGLCKGFPVIVGRDGHSVCYVRPMLGDRNKLMAKYANSWGNWGDAGYGYDSLNQVEKSAGAHAFVLRAVTVRQAG